MIDGCFLKGPYGGQLLTSDSLHGNSSLLPLAFAVVEAENNTDSWTFFRTFLKDAIGTQVGNIPFTFISYRQKVIFLHL